MKIVINSCFGGFGLSHEGILAFLLRKQIDVWPEKLKSTTIPWRYWLVPLKERTVTFDENGFDYNWDRMTNEEHFTANEQYSKQIWDKEHDIPRDDPDLVAVVNELGEGVNDSYANLLVVEIPDGVEWVIEEYDGFEHIAEKHRVWG